VVVDVLGYAIAIVLAGGLGWVAVRERRWWNWLQLAGIALLAFGAVADRGLPDPGGVVRAVGAVAVLVGPPVLVIGLVAWRLRWDAGWFVGDHDAPEPLRDGDRHADLARPEIPGRMERVTDRPTG